MSKFEDVKLWTIGDFKENNKHREHKERKGRATKVFSVCPLW
jgi:hypothetical protein